MKTETRSPNHLKYYCPIKRKERYKLEKIHQFEIDTVNTEDAFIKNALELLKKDYFNKTLKTLDLPRVTSGPKKEIIFTEDHKTKLRSSKLGTKLSEEVKRKMSESKMGNKAWLGKTHSEETKRKMSESAKKRFNNQHHQ